MEELKLRTARRDNPATFGRPLGDTWLAASSSMRITTTIVQTLVRTLGPIQIGLGALFWTYNALNLIPLHMLIGLVLVLSLWVLAGLGARSGIHLALVGVAFAWGLLVVALGMAQMQILPGGLHWVVQVVHLLVGLTLMALGEVLGRRIRERLAPSAPTPSRHWRVRASSRARSG